MIISKPRFEDGHSTKLARGILGHSTRVALSAACYCHSARAASRSGQSTCMGIAGQSTCMGIAGSGGREVNGEKTP